MGGIGSGRQPTPVEQRFWPRVDKRGLDECWLWLGAPTPKGYGMIGVGRRKVHAHVWAWEEINGPVPVGREMHHKCRVKLCVNPAHLVPLTPAEHAEEHRGERLLSACGRGHEFTPENTYNWPNGKGRSCRRCQRDIQARR